MNEQTNAYLRAVDPFPLQSAPNTRLVRFYEALREDRLLTTQCADCACRHWPPRVVCPECLSKRLAWVELPHRGAIHACTVQETGVPPGFPRPLLFAVVTIDELRIFTRLVDTRVVDVRRGRTVRLSPTTVQSGPDGETRYLPTFTVVGA